MKIIGITKNFGTLSILKDLNVEFPEKKISVILGNSGCGKTTLLNIISGKDKNFSGEIQFEKRDYSHRFSYIFQNDNLIPWKTVEGNITFVCKKWYLKDELQRIIERNLSIVNLQSYRDYFPGQLSGGMKKRVGIARAFSFPSDMMLMDEPFSGLDINITRSIIDDFILLQKENPKTIILVTHDLETAIRLGDFFFILSDKPSILKSSVSRDDFTSLETLKEHLIKNLK